MNLLYSIYIITVRHIYSPLSLYLSYPEFPLRDQ